MLTRTKVSPVTESWSFPSPLVFTELRDLTPICFLCFISRFCKIQQYHVINVHYPTQLKQLEFEKHVLVASDCYRSSAGLSSSLWTCASFCLGGGKKNVENSCYKTHIQASLWINHLVFASLNCVSSLRYSLRYGGGRRRGSEDASLLSVRRHREHGLEDGEQRSGDYTNIFNDRSAGKSVLNNPWRRHK